MTAVDGFAVCLQLAASRPSFDWRFATLSRRSSVSKADATNQAKLRVRRAARAAGNIQSLNHLVHAQQ